MQTKIEIKESKIRIEGPYSEDNNKVWRSLGGRFSDGAWDVPDNDTSRAKIAELFGPKSDEVEVLVPACKTSGRGIVQVGGYVLAFRRYRDRPVHMPDGVTLAAGTFRSSGGSKKNPNVDLGGDVVFRLRCRKAFAEAQGLEVAEEVKPGIEV